MKDDIKSYSKEKQIKILKKEILISLIVGIVVTASLCALAVYLLLSGDQSRQMYAVFGLAFIPVSWYIGYFAPRKERVKKIKQLTSEIEKGLK